MTYEIHRISTELDRLPIRLLYITHSSFDKGWHSIKHSHEFIELFYIVKGEGAILLDNKEFSVEKNQLIIINPHINHTEKSSPDKSMEYITLGFDGITLNNIKDKQHSDIIIHHDYHSELLGLIKFLMNELKTDKEQASFISQNILEIILIKLNYYKDAHDDHSEKEISSKLFEITKYIELNYSNPITLDDLAEFSHLNKYYLSHLFKEETGLSPIEYLNMTRIKHAKILLESTNYSISEIGSFTGFSSQSFFSQRFKKITNVSPKDYRISSQEKS